MRYAQITDRYCRCGCRFIARPATLEVIPLKYRTAEQLIPVLKPLLDKSGTLSGMQNQLIVRTIVNGQLVERFDNAVEYRDVTTGFYVVPRLAGDRVTLEINPQRDTLANPDQNLPRGSVNIQQAATTVSGRLGEWIEVGGIVQGVANQQTAILGSTRELSRDNRQILLKVEEIR